ncbi:MAG: hypothetical protein WCH31_09440 [Actinomycetes bacterium]
MSYLYVPIFILVGLLVVFGVMAFLGRFRNGRYLRPLVLALAKIPFMRRMFEKASRSMIEKQNPELASAIRKMERLGKNPDPARAQQALHQLTPAERRAYMELAEQQGGAPEPANRQQRRMQERYQQTNRPPSGTAKRKKRR